MHREISKKRCFPIFSKEDSDLSSFPWRFHRGYAKTTFRDGERKVKSLMAHRIVLGRMLGRNPVAQEICDHINFEKLDNRRENLRVTDAVGSGQHKRRGPFSGVVREKNGRYRSKIVCRGRDYSCGTFDRIEDAALAAKLKRKELGFLE